MKVLESNVLIHLVIDINVKMLCCLQTVQPWVQECSILSSQGGHFTYLLQASYLSFSPLQGEKKNLQNGGKYLDLNIKKTKIFFSGLDYNL